MELYKFFWGALAWIATIAVLWPVNAPLMALAFKIQNGVRPLDMAWQELCYRSVFATGALALLTLACIIFDYFFIDFTDLPAGPIHLILFTCYVPAAAYLLVYSFALTELTEGLGIFIIYIGCPVMVLFLVNALLGIWNPWLDFFYGYLKTPE